MSFQLHPQLEADCISIGALPLCEVLLMNNRHFPWLVLVPRIDNMRELFDLAPSDYRGVMEEIRHVAREFLGLTKADKINVAALGNMVPQLHIHIIARYIEDSAWPHPVWGSPLAEPYTQSLRVEIINKIKSILDFH